MFILKSVVMEWVSGNLGDFAGLLKNTHWVSLMQHIMRI